MNVLVKPERCKQCLLCWAHCPAKAIGYSEEFNANGYRPAEIDHGKCIRCGVCYTMCPDGVYEIPGSDGSGESK